MRKRRKEEQAARRRRPRPYLLDMFGERHSPGPIEMMVGGLTLILISVGVTLAALGDRWIGLPIVAGSVVWALFLASTTTVRAIAVRRIAARRGQLSLDAVAESLALNAPWPDSSVLVRRTIGIVLVLPFEWLTGIILLALLAFNLILFPVASVIIVPGLLLTVHVIGAHLYLGERFVAATRKLTDNPSITGSPLQMLFFWTETASFALFVAQLLLWIV